MSSSFHALQHKLISAQFRTNHRTPRADRIYDHMLKQAALGNITAYYRLACYYAEGTGIQQDDVTARMWFEKAAEQGHTPSMIRCGQALLHGHGVNRNRVRGLYWLLKAANKGDRSACALLGTSYQTGHGLPKSDDLAFKWFLKGANLGSVDAILGLAMCYQRGRGGTQDLVKAQVCLTIAAARGCHFLLSKAIRAPRLTDEQVAEATRLSKPMLSGGQLDF